eukprot:scaffold127552_cov40-Prasinocladus_malaysianus.AAC.2
MPHGRGNFCKEAEPASFGVAVSQQDLHHLQGILLHPTGHWMAMHSSLDALEKALDVLLLKQSLGRLDNWNNRPAGMLQQTFSVEVSLHGLLNLTEKFEALGFVGSMSLTKYPTDCHCRCKQLMFRRMAAHDAQGVGQH